MKAFKLFRPLFPGKAHPSLRARAAQFAAPACREA